jgi:hypothetical protein
MASLRQIHSGMVREADGVGLAGEGDALVTNRARVPVSVRTADCFARNNFPVHAGHYIKFRAREWACIRAGEPFWELV